MFQTKRNNDKNISSEDYWFYVFRDYCWTRKHWCSTWPAPSPASVTRSSPWSSRGMLWTLLIKLWTHSNQELKHRSLIRWIILIRLGYIRLVALLNDLLFLKVIKTVNIHRISLYNPIYHLTLSQVNSQSVQSSISIGDPGQCVQSCK